jgi:hypothetical protein
VIRTLAKPDLCQSCASGHDRPSCMWFPVPCADRLELWLSGASAERERWWKALHAEALRHTGELGDDLRRVARLIWEARS